jgi:hypothetical protein
MVLSTRAAIGALRDIDGLTHRQAQHVIAAGLLGDPEIRGRQRCYDHQRIIDLTTSNPLRRADLDAIFPLGAFIARLGAWRGFDVRASREEQVKAVCDGWYVPGISHIYITWKAETTGGHYPFLATVSDYVVFGATITGRENYGERQRSTNRNSRLTRFTLADAGPWYEQVAGRRLSLGPGYPWLLWGAPVSGPFSRAALVEDHELRRIRMLPR